MTDDTALASAHFTLGATFTHLLGGRVKVMQPENGYRIGMDGALLAAACASILREKRKFGSALELGCGVGGALLSLHARCPEPRLLGLERELTYVALCEDNIRLNCAETVSVLPMDIGRGFRESGIDRSDLVFCNPPYFDDPKTLRAPHLSKRPAWIADDGLGAWLDFAMAAVKDGGDIVFIHRADRMADLLTGLSARCGSFIVRPVLPFAGSDAKRVLVRAKRLGKAPLRLLPGLVLHDHGERKHTPLVEAILLGQADLAWKDAT